MTPEQLAEIYWGALQEVLPRTVPGLAIIPWSEVNQVARDAHIDVAALVLEQILGANRSIAPASDNLGWDDLEWWYTTQSRLDRYTYDVVRFFAADENDGLTFSQIAPKIQDWADHSSGPPRAVYAAAARAITEPPPEDPTTLDRPEREQRRVPRDPR